MKELLAANEAYLFRAARHVSNGPSTFSSGYFAVDADAKALGIANRDPALLERCVTELEQGEKSERALILLQRYTDQELLYARDWRVWLDANKDHLYFTDTGGYKFKLR